jgi:uncharacterized protein VirK/YbjX
MKNNRRTFLIRVWLDERVFIWSSTVIHHRLPQCGMKNLSLGLDAYASVSAAVQSRAPEPTYWQILARSARTVYPRSTPADFVRRWLYCSLHLCHLQHSRRLLNFLDGELMNKVTSENPSLFRKLIRPYVTLTWSAGAKVEAILHHYHFLSRHMAPREFRRAVSPVGVELLSLRAGDRDRLTVRIRCDGKFRKEGEATLDLESAIFGCRVSSLTFVVAPSNSGRPGIIIGAVYGLPAGVSRDIIRDTAKALYGLRPKALLLLLLREMARTWGVGSLLGVGSQMHTSRHLIYRFNRSRLFAVKYSDFWVESGGEMRGDGLYWLPLNRGPRDLQSIPPTKRSQYRHRQTLIAELEGCLRANLESLRS